MNCLKNCQSIDLVYAGATEAEVSEKKFSLKYIHYSGNL